MPHGYHYGTHGQFTNNPRTPGMIYAPDKFDELGEWTGEAGIKGTPGAEQHITQSMASQVATRKGSMAGRLMLQEEQRRIAGEAAAQQEANKGEEQRLATLRQQAGAAGSLQAYTKLTDSRGVYARFLSGQANSQDVYKKLGQDVQQQYARAGTRLSPEEINRLVNQEIARLEKSPYFSEYGKQIGPEAFSSSGMASSSVYDPSQEVRLQDIRQYYPNWKSGMPMPDMSQGAKNKIMLARQQQPGSSTVATSPRAVDRSEATMPQWQRDQGESQQAYVARLDAWGALGDKAGANREQWAYKPPARPVEKPPVEKAKPGPVPGTWEEWDSGEDYWADPNMGISSLYATNWQQEQAEQARIANTPPNRLDFDETSDYSDAMNAYRRGQQGGDRGLADQTYEQYMDQRRQQADQQRAQHDAGQEDRYNPVGGGYTGATDLGDTSDPNPYIPGYAMSDTGETSDPSVQPPPLAPGARGPLGPGWETDQWGNQKQGLGTGVPTASAAPINRGGQRGLTAGGAAGGIPMMAMGAPSGLVGKGLDWLGGQLGGGSASTDFSRDDPDPGPWGNDLAGFIRSGGTREQFLEYWNDPANSSTTWRQEPGTNVNIGYGVNIPVRRGSGNIVPMDPAGNILTGGGPPGGQPGGVQPGSGSPQVAGAAGARSDSPFDISASKYAEGYFGKPGDVEAFKGLYEENYTRDRAIRESSLRTYQGEPVNLDDQKYSAQHAELQNEVMATAQGIRDRYLSGQSVSELQSQKQVPGMRYEAIGASEEGVDALTGDRLLRPGGSGTGLGYNADTIRSNLNMLPPGDDRRAALTEVLMMYEKFETQVAQARTATEAATELEKFRQGFESTERQLRDTLSREDRAQDQQIQREIDTWQRGQADYLQKFNLNLQEAQQTGRWLGGLNTMERTRLEHQQGLEEEAATQTSQRQAFEQEMRTGQQALDQTREERLLSVEEQAAERQTGAIAHETRVWEQEQSRLNAVLTGYLDSPENQTLAAQEFGWAKILEEADRTGLFGKDKIETLAFKSQKFQEGLAQEKQKNAARLEELKLEMNEHDNETKLSVADKQVAIEQGKLDDAVKARRVQMKLEGDKLEFQKTQMRLEAVQSLSNPKTLLMFQRTGMIPMLERILGMSLNMPEFPELLPPGQTIPTQQYLNMASPGDRELIMAEASLRSGYSDMDVRSVLQRQMPGGLGVAIGYRGEGR